MNSCVSAAFYSGGNESEPASENATVPFPLSETHLLLVDDEPARSEDRLIEIEALGRRCREGNLAAWDSLFATVWPELVKFAHRLYRSFDEEDAEDVAQAALGAAIQGIRSFSGRGSFRAWLLGITARQATTFYRAKRARKRGADLLVPLDHHSDQPDEALSPAEVSAVRDRAGILYRALDELSESDRDLIQLHFFGDLTCKEIGEIRRMSAKTVCTRLTRSKEKLRPVLNRLNLMTADG